MTTERELPTPSLQERFFAIAREFGFVETPEMIELRRQILSTDKKTERFEDVVREAMTSYRDLAEQAIDGISDSGIRARAQIGLDVVSMGVAYVVFGRTDDFIETFGQTIEAAYFIGQCVVASDLEIILDEICNQDSDQ